MDCKQCAENLTAYLDGELSAADSERVQSHLGFCPTCSEELRGLRETVNFVESHNCILEPRIGSWNLVRARIIAEQPVSPSGFWGFNRWRFAMATLAIVAAFALGYLQYQQTQRKNLDRYISEYVQEREAQRKTHLGLIGADFGSRSENLSGDNPFVSIKATVAGNPFRLEDR